MSSSTPYIIDLTLSDSEDDSEHVDVDIISLFAKDPEPETERKRGRKEESATAAELPPKKRLTVPRILSPCNVEAADPISLLLRASQSIEDDELSEGAFSVMSGPLEVTENYEYRHFYIPTKQSAMRGRFFEGDEEISDEGEVTEAFDD